MPNKTNKHTKQKPQGKIMIKKRADVAAEPLTAAAQPASTPQASSMDNLKQNLTGKRKAIFEILDDVKKVKPEQWQDPSQIEQLAKSFASKLGLPVPEQRIKQFVNAYKDATKNGPSANVDDLVKKYGKNVDNGTLNQIKKFMPKNKDE